MGAMLMAEANLGPDTEHMLRRTDSLWDFLEAMPERDDLRAELIGGEIVVSPSPVKYHAWIARQLAKMLGAVLDDGGLEAAENITVVLAESDEGFIPDLIVVPVEELLSREWKQPVEEVVMAAEVVSDSSVRRDNEVKLASCARSGVPLYVVIDPREGKGTLKVCSEPQPDGRYRVQKDYVFGEVFKLPEPLPAEIDTAKFGPLPPAKPKTSSAA